MRKIPVNFDILLNRISLFLIISLILFAYFNSLLIGLSWDENFHHVNGLLRFKYLSSLGKFQNYDFLNNKYYPGLYDTISYAIGHILQVFDENFYQKHIVEIKHSINFLFSVFSLLGLYLTLNFLFNKSISLLAVLLTLLNPFFFGHMGMNPKDTIIFFSLIWFCYFFYKYLFYEKNIYFNLVFASFFVGFGCGVRISFLAVIFPVLICGLIYLFNKSKDNYSDMIKRLFFHFAIALIIMLFLTLICWPHIYQDSLFLLFSIIKNSINWSAGARLGLIDGIFYETHKTPPSYFLDMLKFKMPFFLSILMFFSYILFFINNNPLIKIVTNFNIKFIIVNSIIFFPIIISIIFTVKIYDYLRLFIFILPFISLLASFSLYYLLISFNESFNSKLGIFLILFFFIIFFYRFVSLLPYQYSYVNFSYPQIKDSINKFEHDYWGTSLKELVVKIKNKYSQSEIDKIKFGICGADPAASFFYLNKDLNVSNIYNLNDSTHILMTNRASFNVNDKTTCFNKHMGVDLVSVTRDQLLLSVLREKMN